MKKIFGLLFVLVMLTSCGEDDDDSGPQEVCQTTGEGTCAFVTCSDGVNTYYTWNGNRYNCDAGDCTQAANDLAQDLVAAGCTEI